MAQDIFQTIGSLDAAGIRKIIDRLEFRGTDETFVAMREAYLQAMNLTGDDDILDLGCGTGVVARALAARSHLSGKIVGVDFSKELIDAAKQLAQAEDLVQRIEFRSGDAAALEDADESYDAVILHTLVSHVPDPSAAVAEACRVLRPGGMIAVFDGDYASISYATGDHQLDAEMVSAILDAIVANPYVMRELPGILRANDMGIENFFPHLLAEAGSSAFFASLAESYVPMVIRSKTATEAKAKGWLEAFRKSVDDGSVFASCNYYAYLGRKRSRRK